MSCENVPLVNMLLRLIKNNIVLFIQDILAQRNRYVEFLITLVYGCYFLDEYGVNRYS